MIPTYRRPQLLRRALESVLAQTWPHLEVVVTDNASRDGTREMVEAMAAADPRIRYFEQPENLGASRNFRFGWQQVRTPWMSFLSDDDLLFPGFYAHALATLERHPDARFFCGQTVTYDGRDGSHGVRPTKGWTSRRYAPGEATALMVERLFTWTSSVFSIDVCHALGDFAPDSFEDVVFLARAAARYPFVTSLQPCSLFFGWEEGFSQAVDAAEAARRYAATARVLAEDPAVDRGALAHIETYLDGRASALLAGRLRRAFLAARWTEFDDAAAALEGLGPVKSSRRRMIALGRRRERHPGLVRAARAALGWHRAWRKRAKGGGTALGLDEVVARYAPVLLGAAATSAGASS